MASTQAAAGAKARGIGEAALEHADRNHVIAVIAGALGIVSQSFQHPELIIAGLIYALTESPMLVALVTLINKAGALGPQLVAGSILEHQVRRMPYFVVMTWLRAAAYTALLVALWMLSRQVETSSLIVFFAAYLVSSVIGGTAHITHMDMVGRMIPSDRLGSFFGAKNALGNILAIVAGLVIIQPVLGALEVPVNYLLLTGIGAAVMIVDMTLFSRCREVDGPRATKKTSLAESLQRGFRWLKSDHNYRMYIWSRVGFRFNYLGLAFFIPYGTQRLGGRESANLAILGGIMVASMQISRVVTSALWGKMADRRGFRACLLAGGICFVIAPALALTAPMLPEVFSVDIPGTPAALDLPLAVYLVALLAIGAAIQGTALGGQYFLVSSAPPHRRPSYLGFANTITSPLTLLPIGGAVLAQVAGMSGLFILLCFTGFLSLGAAWFMRNEHTHSDEQADQD